MCTFRRIDDVQTNGNSSGDNLAITETEPVTDGRLSAYSKRPVSMFEARESPNTPKLLQIPESRTTTSMYQMLDGAAASGTAPATNGNYAPAPRVDEVKYRTEIVTRRIQELWSVMQEMTANDAFVPCAERIRVAVAELTAIFPAVN